jgi:hypothetical protein
MTYWRTQGPKTLQMFMGSTGERFFAGSPGSVTWNSADGTSRATVREEAAHSVPTSFVPIPRRI